jgi:hypothetical protein
MNRALIFAVLFPATVLAAEAPLPPAAVARYQEANAKISARAFSEAIAMLNELAAQYPAVAELYASRCSALVGQRSHERAEADCAYALRLKPDLSIALYTLGLAQEGQGKRDAAIDSFQKYAALGAAAPYRDQALAHVNALTAGPPPPPPPPPSSAEATIVIAAPAYRAAPPTRCLMGSDGRNACGYNCRIGSDGVSACADTPDGTCSIDAWGHATCTRVAGYGYGVVGGPKPECKMSSRGRNTCGYNCKHGSNGEVYCASTPNGRCALNSDGSWSCP